MARDHFGSRCNPAKNRNVVQPAAICGGPGQPLQRPLQVRCSEFDIGPSLAKSLHFLSDFKVIRWKLLLETNSNQLFTTTNDDPVPHNVKLQSTPSSDGMALEDDRTLTKRDLASLHELSTNKHGQRDSCHSEHHACMCDNKIKKRGHSEVALDGMKKKKARSNDGDDWAEFHESFCGLQHDLPSEAGSESDSDDDDDDDMVGVTLRRVSVRVDSLTDAYEKMFKMIQQKGCKKIMQTWIKKCHPKKQARFPYNGGGTARDQPDYDDKNKGKHTAPPYWLHQDDWQSPKATGCRHREPDHITKRERLNMCVHLLRLGRKFPEYNFDLELLKESTQGITEQHGSHFHEGGKDLLSTIYIAREQEIQWEMQAIDDDTTVSVLLPEQEKEKERANKQPSGSNVNSKTSDTEREKSAEAELKQPRSATSSFNQDFASVCIKAETPSTEEDEDMEDDQVPSEDETMPLSASANDEDEGTSSGIASRSMSQTTPSTNMVAPAMQRTMSERPVHHSGSGWSSLHHPGPFKAEHHGHHYHQLAAHLGYNDYQCDPHGLSLSNEVPDPGFSNVQSVRAAASRASNANRIPAAPLTTMQTPPSSAGGCMFLSQIPENAAPTMPSNAIDALPDASYLMPEELNLMNNPQRRNWGQAPQTSYPAGEWDMTQHQFGLASALHPAHEQPQQLHDAAGPKPADVWGVLSNSTGFHRAYNI